MDYTLIIMAVMIMAAGIIALEFGIAVAILEIFAGVIAANLFGMSTVPWLDFLAQYGLIGLLFFAGFEMDFVLLKKYWKRSTVLASISFAVPLAIIFSCALFLLPINAKSSLLIAIGLASISVALVYNILLQKGKIGSAVGQTLLASAMIVDIFSLASITFVFEGLSVFTVSIMTVMAVSLFIVPKLGKKLFSRYKGDQTELKTRFVLIALLAILLIAEEASIHGAMFAFLAGFLFSELIEEHAKLEEKLKGIVFGFMAPMFFFSSGLSMRFDVITLGGLALIAIFSAIVLCSKYLSSYITSKIFFKGDVPDFTAWIFVFNLTFGIIAAEFGLESGLLNHELYVLMLSVILITSALASFIIKITPHDI